MPTRLLVALILLLISPPASTSPLTSADLATAYGELQVVQLAQESHTLSADLGAFLSSDAPTDEKAAVISALGWEARDSGNARRFVDAIAAREGVETIDVEFGHMNASDRFVLGYLLAMEDYRELAPLDEDASGVWSLSPRDWLASAAALLPEDFTVHLVRALVESQVALYDVNLCALWLHPHQVLERFPQPARNLRAEAVDAAWAYVGEYEGHCYYGLDEPEGGDVRMNWIYDVEGYRDWIVTGTQRGVVVWDPDQAEPVSTASEFICGTLVVWGDSIWAGCDERVYRYDGNEWRSYLRNTYNDAEYYAPVLGPNGELFVQYGGEGFVYDPSTDLFVSAAVPTGYDVLYQDGQLWQIDFMGGVMAPSGTFPIRSDRYPGSNPRALFADSLGHVWVADFDDGYFRFDEEEGAFSSTPGPSSRGTSVAFDEPRERVWMAHYTDGVSLVEGDSVEEFDLSRLDNIRDIHVDAAGNLWVGGWGELLRLSEATNGWRQQSWVIE